MAGWLGKGRGTVARLAAVLALLDWTANRPNNAPPPTVITTQHLCDAWDLWERYYRPHAQAVFDRAGPADGDRQGKHKARQHARRVIGWIRARGVEGDLARGGAARGAQPAGERRRRRRGDPGAGAGGRVARSRGRRGGLSRPRPPGAALAGQSAAPAAAKPAAQIAEKKPSPDPDTLAADAVSEARALRPRSGGRGRGPALARGGRGGSFPLDRGISPARRTASRSRSRAGGLAKMIERSVPKRHALPERGRPARSDVMSGRDARAPMQKTRHFSAAVTPRAVARPQR